MSEYAVTPYSLFPVRNAFSPHQHIPQLVGLGVPLPSGLLRGRGRYRWSAAPALLIFGAAVALFVTSRQQQTLGQGRRRRGRGGGAVHCR